ncbi:hypothetical protein RUM44_006880 [Polyplax serrata]|uniref:CFA20 domain-containing protein n=1 Tax=Polyplax serrata TaxID=468196 RepID=A0ABR1AJE2_POLSC
MFRKAFQKGLLTVLYAGGSNPLKIWDRLVVNGHVKRVTDEDVRTLVLEMRGTNVATCYVYTPIDPKEVLGITLPFLVMIIKNLKKYFSFEIQVLDDRNMRRRFRVSNFQTTTKVRPFGTTMPIGLNPGWNQIQFNLADFTKRAYGSTYVETQRIQIHANCRIRRIYFCDKLYSDDDLPTEYRLFYPCVEEKKKKEVVVKTVRDEVPPPSEVGDEMEQEEVEEGEGEEYHEVEQAEVEIAPPPEGEPEATAPPEEAVEEPGAEEGEPKEGDGGDAGGEPGAGGDGEAGKAEGEAEAPAEEAAPEEAPAEEAAAD